MNARIISLAAILSAAGVVATLLTDHGTSPDDEGLHGDSADEARDLTTGREDSYRALEGTRPAPDQHPAPADTSPVDAGPFSGQTAATVPPAWMGYRFRPLDGERSERRLDPPGGLPPAAHASADQGFRDSSPRWRDAPADTAGHRFREPDRPRTTGRYQPYAPALRPWQDLDPRSGYPPASTARQDLTELPGQGAYRFRPLDDDRRSKRWRGNYHRMSTSPAQLAGPRDGEIVAPHPG